MKLRLAVVAAELLLCGLVSMPSGGCTILLPFSSWQTHRRWPKGLTVPAEQVATLKPGIQIAIVTTSGDTLEGTFAGVARAMPLVSYSLRYEAWRVGKGTGWPDLGSRVEVGRTTGEIERGSLAGFGWRSVWLARGRRDAKKIAFANMTDLRLETGGTIAAESLIAMRSDADLPSRATIELTQYWHASQGSSLVGPQDQVLVPADDVDRIVIRRAGMPMAVAILLGAAGDALILGIVAVSAYAASAGSGCGGSYSLGYYARDASDGVPSLEPLGSDFDPRTGIPVDSYDGQGDGTTRKARESQSF